MWEYDETRWRGNVLYAGKRPLMRIEPDRTGSGMWFVVSRDGTSSDGMNKIWAMHTARTWALSILNSRERGAEGAASA
jgi:hypothetical protein